VTTQVDKFADALRRATDLLNKYKVSAMDPLHSSLIEIVRDFTEIRSKMGDTPDVMQTMAVSVQKALEEFKEPFREVQDQIFFGEESPFDALDQWARIQTRFTEARSRFRSGDFHAAEDLRSIIPEFIRLAMCFINDKKLERPHPARVPSFGNRDPMRQVGAVQLLQLGIVHSVAVVTIAAGLALYLIVLTKQRRSALCAPIIAMPTHVGDIREISNKLILEGFVRYNETGPDI
jgi:hypothetical protein